jgi:hypothetical protein
VPVISPYRQFVVDGSLMSYGPDTADIFRRSTSYVDRILKGESPGNLPVQAPSKFELVFNLNTAKALGLSVRSSFLQLADEVIEEVAFCFWHKADIGLCRAHVCFDPKRTSQVSFFKVGLFYMMLSAIARGGVLYLKVLSATARQNPDLLSIFIKIRFKSAGGEPNATRGSSSS